MILGMLWLAYYNPKIDWRIEDNKVSKEEEEEKIRRKEEEEEERRK